MSHNPLNLRLYKSAYKTKIPPGYKGILKITPREKKGRKEGRREKTTKGSKTENQGETEHEKEIERGKIGAGK